MHFRPIRKDDLEACAAMLPPASGHRAVSPALLARFWRELLHEERISGGGAWWSRRRTASWRSA